GQVLPDNRAMLELAHSLGFTSRFLADEGAVGVRRALHEGPARPRRTRARSPRPRYPAPPGSTLRVRGERGARRWIPALPVVPAAGRAAPGPRGDAVRDGGPRRDAHS